MDYASALFEQSELFGELVREADLTTPVSACPGWSLSQLLRHVGRGDRWAAQIVSDRMDSVLDPRAVRDGKPPEDPVGTFAWLSDSPRALVDAVAATGGDTPVWTFVGPRPASWWVRRRLHEWTVHRADAALALGVAYELAPALAADGVSEWLGLVAARRSGELPAALDAGETLHLHATDDGLGSAGEWLIRGEPDGVSWENAHAKADTAVRGSAVDLMLLLLRRRPVGDEFQLFGDLEILATWLDRTGF
ncbi:MAG: maleylpyruvate isomerase family mycothiol-dependent enzyme [Actinomycetota bacterium]|nr:maleylpyruvate isomerase family mycothiol-dependent enzyme [Actinomycetota bacterium]